MPNPELTIAGSSTWPPDTTTPLITKTLLSWLRQWPTIA